MFYNLMHGERLSCTKLYPQRAFSDNSSPAVGTSRDIRSLSMTGSVSAIVMTVFGGTPYKVRTKFMDCVQSRRRRVAACRVICFLSSSASAAGAGTRASTLSCSWNKCGRCSDWISRPATWRHAFISQLVPGQCRQSLVYYERLKLTEQLAWRFSLYTTAQRSAELLLLYFGESTIISY